MIYLQAPGGKFRVVVIDTTEADRIRTGAPVLSPDRSIMLAWTPDPEWLLQRIQTGAGTSGDIARAIDEAARRPEAGGLLGADGVPLPSTNGKPHAVEREEKSVGDPPQTAAGKIISNTIVTILNTFPAVNRAICSVPPAEWANMVRQLEQENQ